MSFAIPTLSEPFYSSRVRLDDQDYMFEFWYSVRSARFYLSVFDVEEKPLVCGLKLVCGVPLLRYHRNKVGLPAGDLIVVSTSPDQSPPTLTELGEGLRCELTYFEHSELTTAQGV